jgi:hypothetical protein
MTQQQIERKHEYDQEYKRTHKEQVSLSCKKYRESHKEEIEKAAELWKLNNPEKVRKYTRTALSKRKANDAQFKMEAQIRTRLYVALRVASGKNNSSKALRDFGCSIVELRKHIESQFGSGMTWENQGRGHDRWGIHHIKALSEFNVLDPDERAKAQHFSNVIPVWNEVHREIEKIKGEK